MNHQLPWLPGGWRESVGSAVQQDLSLLVPYCVMEIARNVAYPVLESSPIPACTYDASLRRLETYQTCYNST